MSGTAGGRPIRHGTRQELTDEFNRQRLWPRIYARELREQLAAERPPTESPGGRAQIVKHNDGARHAATTHRILDSDGRAVHWDEKDCILPDGTKLVRRG